VIVRAEVGNPTNSPRLLPRVVSIGRLSIDLNVISSVDHLNLATRTSTDSLLLSQSPLRDRRSGKRLDHVIDEHSHPVWNPGAAHVDGMNQLHVARIKLLEERH